MINRIYSYSLNELGDTLIDVIKNRKNFFEKITIIVPNIKLQQWFKTYWLKSQNDILMNIEFVTIDKGLLKLIDIDKPYKLLKKDALKSLIIKSLSQNIIQLPSEIENFLYNDDKTINSIKVYDLSSKLADLFGEYEKDQFQITGWEKELYDIVLNDADKYFLSSLSKIYNDANQMKVNNNELYFFGFVNFNKLQEKIINSYAEKSNITLLLLKKQIEDFKEYSIVAAPSKLREVESVHSEICQLLKNKNINYSDFLVLAPDISQYEGVINRVFNQDNVNFPNIPYSINDMKKIDTNVTVALKKLFEIFNKKFYSRLDFFELISNLDIQNSRGITEDDVKNWTQSIINMNVFRNREYFDDWEYAKRRVLFSKVSGINDEGNNIIELKDGSYLPYSNINFDNESIVKFVSLIDDLKSLNDLLKNMNFVNEENIIQLKTQLDKWFSIKDSNNFETNKQYMKIVNVINMWLLMGVSNNTIPLNTLFYTFFDASKAIEINANECFVKGITFSNFDTNAILSSKYVFFLNTGSNELPKKIVKSELDLRDYDISKKEEGEDAFIIQYQNADNKFYISYINKNLKTDEDYFQSSYVLKLKAIHNIEEKVITLDETRSWSELFTKKEYKNKDYFLGLLSLKENVNENEIKENNHEYLKRVSIKNMASFLTEPLKYKSELIFGKKDLTEERLLEEYEPFELSNILHATLIKKVINSVLENKEVSKDKQFDEEYLDEIKNRFNLEHLLPDINDYINETAFKGVINDSRNVVEKINEETSGNYEVIKLPDLELKTENVEWKLVCNEEICRSVDGLNRKYFQLKKFRNKPQKSDYLYLYIASLSDVALLPNNKYYISLHRGITEDFEITPSKAIEILQKIYKLMNNYEENICLPIDLFKEKQLKTLYKLMEKLSQKQGSPWSYFDDKNIFDYETQLGYNYNDFFEKFDSNKRQIISLIEFYDKDDDGGVDNE